MYNPPNQNQNVLQAVVETSKGMAIIGPNYSSVTQQDERQLYFSTIYTNANTERYNPSGAVTYRFVTNPPICSIPCQPQTQPQIPWVYQPRTSCMCQPQIPCVCQHSPFIPQPMSVEELHKDKGTSTCNLVSSSTQTENQTKNDEKTVENSVVENVQIPESQGEIEKKQDEQCSTQKPSDNDDIISIGSLRTGKRSVLFEKDIEEMLQRSHDSTIAPLGEKFTISPVPSTTSMAKSSRVNIRSGVGPSSESSNSAEDDYKQDSGSCGCACSSGIGNLSSLAGLNFNTLDEFLGRWFQDLMEEEAVFLHQAMEINTRAQCIMQNRIKLVGLQQDVEWQKAYVDHLDNWLEFARCQYLELERMLVPLSKVYDKIEHVDECRYPIYIMAERMDCDLKQLYMELTELITELNARIEDLTLLPMGQLARTLNLHLYTLNSIDGRIGLLEQELRHAACLQKHYCEIQRNLKHVYGFHIV